MYCETPYFGMRRTLAALLSVGRNDRLFPIVNTINDLIKMREDAATRMYATMLVSKAPKKH